MAFRDGCRRFRPPPRPLRVLDSRRGVPDSRPRQAGCGARDAGGQPHRPRLDGRRRPALAEDPRHRRQARRRLRGLRRRRPQGAHQGQRPPHAPRGRQHRLRQPDQALLARLPRGLLLQAARRLVAARRALRRADRALRLPFAGACARRSRRTASATRAQSSTACRSVFGKDNVYVELQNAHLDVQARLLPQLAQLATNARHPDRRDRRRALPPRHRRARTRGAALHPVRRLAQEPEPLEVRDRPLLLQVAARDGARLPERRGGDAAHARGRRALQRRDRPQPDPPAALRRSRRPRRVRLPRRAVRARPRASATTRSPPELQERLQVRAQDDQGDGLHRLLPDRLGLHPLREDATASPSARAAAPPPARSSPTRSRSPTSTRSATT